MRVLGAHGNAVAEGIVVGFGSADRAHVSKTVPARREAVVDLGGRRAAYPLGRLRKVRRGRE